MSFLPLRLVTLIATAALFSVGCAVDVDRDAPLRAILREAEQVGLPMIPGGGTLMSGDTKFLAPWGKRQETATSLHYRLPDGSWLVDLCLHVPAEAVDVTQLTQADLNTFGNGSYLCALGAGSIPYALLEVQRSDGLRPGRSSTRRLAEGYTYWSRLGAPLGYPRPLHPADAADALRIECAIVLLQDLWTCPPEQTPRCQAAALGLSPASWRPALTEIAANILDLRQTPIGPPRPVVDQHLPDARLIDLITDGRPTGQVDHGIPRTVSQTALRQLHERWLLDPALFAGRDPDLPLDAAERKILAESLRTWLAGPGTRDLSERMADLAARFPPVDLVRHLARSQAWLAPRQDGAAPPYDQTWQILAKAMAPAIADGLAHHGLTGANPQDLWCLEHWFGDLAPIAAAALDALPLEGPLALDLAAGQDRHGQPEALDRLVEERLATGPGATSLNALGQWIQQPRPSRWARLRTLAASDGSDPTSTAVLAAMGRSWVHEARFSGPRSPALALALAAMGMTDTRRLPMALHPLLAEQTTQAREGATDVMSEPRICDLAMVQFRREIVAHLGKEGVQTMFGDSLGDRDLLNSSVPILTNSSLKDRDDYRMRLLRVMTPDVRHAMAKANLEALPLPTDGAVAGAALTDAESHELREILLAAKEVGIPDLGGVVVAQGWTPRGQFAWTWRPVLEAESNYHLQLVGTNTAEDFGENRLTAGTLSHLTARLTGLETPSPEEIATSAWDVTATLRLAQAGFPYEVAHLPRLALLPAIGAWREGTDTDGRGIVATAILQAACEEGPPLPIIDANSGAIWYQAVPHGILSRTAMPSVPRMVRLALVRWAIDRFLRSSEPDAIVKVRKIIAALAQPEDRPRLSEEAEARYQAWHGRIRAPHPRDLVARLVTSPDVLNLRNLKGSQDQPSLDGLFALLLNDQPTRWRVGGETRTVGEAALAAVAQFWNVDPRWAVIKDPQVIAALPAEQDRKPGDTDLPADTFLWERLPWTQARRAAVMEALMRSWRRYSPGSLDRLLAAALRHMPEPDWETLEIRLWNDNGPLLNGLTRLIQELPEYAPVERNRLVRCLAPLMTLLPAHQDLDKAVSTLTSTLWGHHLAALRQRHLGDATAWDNLMTQALRGDSPPEPVGLSSADPLHNLEAWLEVPDPGHLSILLETLDGPLQRGTTTWVLRFIGSTYWPLNGPFSIHRMRTQLSQEDPGSMGLALAWVALGDRRRIGEIPDLLAPGAVSSPYGEWRRLPVNAENWPPSTPRVCDYVLNNICASPDWHVIATDPILGTAVKKQATIADRDRAIQEIRTRILAQLATDPKAAALMPLLQARRSRNAQ